MGALCPCGEWLGRSGAGAQGSAASGGTTTYFDRSHMAASCVIAGRKISGSGSCLASTALHQDRAFWEFSVVETGVFSVGVSRRVKEGLEGTLGNGVTSWCFSSEARGIVNGDTIGVSWDQGTGRPALEIYLNGTLLPDASVARTRGAARPYPAATIH
jgi:hypothetical protein